jgi:hypothetical protein
MAQAKPKKYCNPPRAQPQGIHVDQCYVIQACTTHTPFEVVVDLQSGVTFSLAIYFRLPCKFPDGHHGRGTR